MRESKGRRERCERVKEGGGVCESNGGGGGVRVKKGGGV